MRILRVFFAIGITVLSISEIGAQNKNVVVNEPTKVTELVEYKKKHNNNISTNDKFRLQIFYGKGSEAKQALASFRSLHPEIDATITYSTPSYKVMAGNFKTRIEAERNLKIVKKSFPNTLLIRPGR
ncbi:MULTISPECIES: SPOR domain-containing protein [Myroides]|uniref:SPOR domain-containing protein n=1 Tax=Myroides albus TaxID=2562892 RepID=A0A6I3LGC3_9FLAO|nr:MULTISPECIES: SPOR domain-containing protein [Myroides]MTG96854.1 SPOR domain-containing protein [Myroides albus]MVX36959.1 SPOR domain-containing protein [Myroides sp. LoEW2-1]UVD78396.1 SPOR domain-containing protein [Myroides albus]